MEGERQNEEAEDNERKTFDGRGKKGPDIVLSWGIKLHLKGPCQGD